MARSWPLRPRSLHAGFWPCERVMVSASHLLLTLALALQNSLAKKGQPLDFLIHVTGLLLFSRERKSHMDEFVHVAVNCKWNTHGHHGYKPDWLVSMRYKPLSEIAVIVRVIKLCCFSLSHDQHSFAQKLTLLACFKAYTHNLSLSTQVFAGRLANRISEYRKMSKNVDIMAILAGAPFA